MLTAHYNGYNGHNGMMGLNQFGLRGPSTIEELMAKLESTTIGSVVLALQFLRPASAVVCGIHGYRRHHDSWGAAAGWAALGLLLPVVSPLVAVAQGYGKEKSSWR